MSVLLSRACEYAIQALLEMARHPKRSFWSVAELARRTGVPAAFLGKTLQKLAQHGLLRSAIGRKGGFAFARDPDEITILQIVEIVDGPELSEACALGFPECGGDHPCPFHDDWSRIRAELLEALSQRSLKALVERGRLGSR